MLDIRKTRMIGLPCGEETLTMLSRCHRIPDRDGATDRQTDRIAISISRVSVRRKMCQTNFSSTCTSKGSTCLLKLALLLNYIRTMNAVTPSDSNRFRTEQGHCGACRRKWRLTDTDLCPCGETQTMSHIVESCPLTKLNGGLSRLHSADDDAVSWLTSYG